LAGLQALGQGEDAHRLELALVLALIVVVVILALVLLGDAVADLISLIGGQVDAVTVTD
jgi:Flp pilus assembly pilin Flp